jgi:hypothetical protein
MYEAAVVILSRVKKASGLKDWAQAIAKRSGIGKARVALARKLCTAFGVRANRSVGQHSQRAPDLRGPAKC